MPASPPSAASATGPRPAPARRRERRRARRGCALPRWGFRPSSETIGKAGPDRLEEHGGAELRPQQKARGEREAEERGRDIERVPAEGFSFDELGHLALASPRFRVRQ